MSELVPLNIGNEYGNTSDCKYTLGYITTSFNGLTKETILTA